MINKILDELENLIDSATEDQLYSEWVAFHEGKFTGNVFRPSRKTESQTSFDLPKITINEAIDDIGKMTEKQFGSCFRHLAKGDGFFMSIRCDYGTGILPSVFGCKMFEMDKEQNTTPMALPFDNGPEDIKKILDAGPPDLNTGFGGKVFESCELMVSLMKDYPKISKYVHLYHPDLQGPLDVCEILWGCSLFLDFIDQPELVKDFLALITDTYLRFMKKWYEIRSPSDTGYSVHWDMLHRGNVALRLDSATNLSPEMYTGFSRSYDAKIMSELGGGVFHFCGRGDHYIDQATAIEGVGTIDMSQPRCNNMEIIFANTIERGINLIGMPEHWVDEQLAEGMDFKGRVHCKWRPGTDKI